MNNNNNNNNEIEKKIFEKLKLQMQFLIYFRQTFCGF